MTAEEFGEFMGSLLQLTIIVCIITIIVTFTYRYVFGV